MIKKLLRIQIIITAARYDIEMIILHIDGGKLRLLMKNGWHDSMSWGTCRRAILMHCLVTAARYDIEMIILHIDKRISCLVHGKRIRPHRAPNVHLQRGERSDFIVWRVRLCGDRI